LPRGEAGRQAGVRCYNITMLLTVDAGNTNIVFGLFKRKKLVSEWRYPTEDYRPPKIGKKIDSIVVASVVPSLNRQLKLVLKKKFGCQPFFVTAENIPGLIVSLKNKKEIGSDRVVDALAAYKLFGGPTIIIDFGTATTFDVVSAEGAYLGGVIAPGISLARDALYEQTEKLPKIEIEAPKRVIGNDTKSAMQSGLVYGYVAMVEGMVHRIKLQITNYKLQTNSNSKFQNSKQKIKVIATGGLAQLICKYTTVVDRIDDKLTLKGLRIIADYVEMG